MRLKKDLLLNLWLTVVRLGPFFSNACGRTANRMWPIFEFVVVQTNKTFFLASSEDPVFFYCSQLVLDENKYNV